MKRMILKLVLLSVLAGVYAYAVDTPEVCSPYCPICSLQQHRCYTPCCGCC
jgi:hypothetical protein